jgi:uncharacterized surface protein with fasciclin (FAS1) repeats
MRIIASASILVLSALVGCDNGTPPTKTTAAAAAAPAAPNADPAVPADPTNIVNIAGHSKDHTTLVAALKAADYVGSVSNAGPLTVFAPTNAAFDKLPKGTLDELVKPEKQEDLRNILKYHVTVSTYQTKDFKDGQILAMANGAKVTLHVKDGKVSVNDANVVASIPASNGIVHVVDGVLLPPAPK